MHLLANTFSLSLQVQHVAMMIKEMAYGTFLDLCPVDLCPGRLLGLDVFVRRRPLIPPMYDFLDVWSGLLVFVVLIFVQAAVL
ncbi:hypothetical protein BDW66DRAFT_54685 [Aspergillus desertorum]